MPLTHSQNMTNATLDFLYRIVLPAALLLFMVSASARAQIYPSSDPRRFTLVKTWAGTFNATLPATVSKYEFTGETYYCKYTQTRSWTVNGQCTLDLDHTIDPPDSMVATWTGTGTLTGSYSDVTESDCTYSDGSREFCTETEESTGLQPMEPVGDYYFMDIMYDEGASYGTYHFVTQNITFDTSTSAPCSQREGTSIVGFGPFETDYSTPLPSSGLTLSGSIDNIYASFYGIDDLYVDFNWTLAPASQQEGSLEITKLKQLSLAQTGSETDFVFHNGRLVLSAEATVSPPELADQIEWDVPTIGSDDDRTVKITSNPLTGVSALLVTYKKLPESNDDFGSKTLTAKIADAGVSDAKDFRVFFDRDATDHPDSQSGSVKSANWYYYWSQGPVPQLENFTYENTDKGGYYDWTTGKMTIGKTAASRAFGPMNQPLTDTKTGTHSCTLVRDRVEGIQAVAAIIAHELRHKYLVEKVVARDQDGDMVRYEEEEAVEPWTNYEDPNTYGLTVEMFYGDTQSYIDGGKTRRQRRQRKSEIDTATEQLAGVGDNEIKAIFAEKNRECDSAKDWAWPGSQSGGE